SEGFFARGFEFVGRPAKEVTRKDFSRQLVKSVKGFPDTNLRCLEHRWLYLFGPAGWKRGSTSWFTNTVSTGGRFHRADAPEGCGHRRQSALAREPEPVFVATAHPAIAPALRRSTRC